LSAALTRRLRDLFKVRASEGCTVMLVETSHALLLVLTRRLRELTRISAAAAS
jgi:hypothetical protein